MERQRQLIEALAREGRDASSPIAYPGCFGELQDLHVQDLNRLRAELADLKKQFTESTHAKCRHSMCGPTAAQNRRDQPRAENN